MDSDAIYERHLEVFLLWACRETGVIEELLNGNRTAAEITEATGITERAAGIVLDALVDLGHASRSAGGYQASDSLHAFDPDTETLERGILPHRIDSLENYMRLPEMMRENQFPERTDEGFKNYVGAMATLEDRVVREIVTTVEHAHPRPDRVLDVGGGPGRFSGEFTRRGADVTLVDRPQVLELLADHHRELGVSTTEGDALESLPAGFDLAFSARMTSSFTPEEIGAYFQNAYEALDPGGTFVCVERISGRSEVAARFAVHMLVFADSGGIHTASTYRDALDTAGFVDREIREIPGTVYQAVIGHKPE
jgi:SAM-dependent methyltransferase